MRDEDPMEMAEKLAQLDPTRPWYSIEAAAKSGDKKRAKVSIYDAIGGWFGIRAADFVREVQALDVDEIELHLNSPGGSVWDGIAIMNTLRSHKASVQVIVDGIAASIASTIAMAGDEIVMARGAQMMIHDPSAVCLGTAEDMTKAAEILNKSAGNLAAIYAARAGGDAADWRQAMLAETWYDADEAVAAGLADRSEDVPDDAKATATFDLSMFHYAGRGAAPAPANLAASLAQGRATALAQTATATTQPPVSPEPGQPNRKEDTVDHTEFLTCLRTRLGVQDAAADETAILAALDEYLAERATTTATLPEGAVAIESGALAALQADAAAGREALANQVAARRDGKVLAALQAGKITPAQRDQWRASLDKDEDGITALLDSMAAVVPVTAKAITAADDQSTDDTNYESIYNRKEA